MLSRRIFLAIFAAAALSAAVTPARLDQQVQAYAELGKFNGAVAVARDGKPVLARGYGKANFEWDIPNSPDTKFRLGSITKQFTGMAVLLLEEQGKLSVADPIARLIPEAPEAWKAVTIHHLLTHTSGIPNFTALPDYNKLKRTSTAPVDTARALFDKPLEFDPGTKMKYSNTGYILLGAIIERASGVTYDEFMRKNIFDPLGMTDTGYDWNRAVIPKRAAGYMDSGRGPVNADFIDMLIPHAAGGLYSTVNDFIKWDAALREGKILKPESYEKYFKPVLNNYAYGWVVETKNGVLRQSHGGGIDGFSTTFIRIPSERLMVAVFANLLPNQGGKLAEELIGLAMGEDLPKPVKRARIELPETTLKQYVGEYELRPDFILTVTLEDGQLMTQATNQGKIPVLAESENVFYPLVIDATITFQKDESGKVTGLILDQNGRKIPAKRR